MDSLEKSNITLEHGGGGSKSWQFFQDFRKILKFTGQWKRTSDDGAVFDLKGKKLVFTTDGFIIDPLFFPGGDIGKIAICGTINDLAVMGAKPIGLSLSLVIEEGFSWSDLKKILGSINQISQETKIPVVTGDTKVTEKGKIDKIEITTAGVGLAKKIVSNSGLRPGDLIFASGGLGEHGLVILAQRFNFKTKIKSDSQSILKEVQAILKYLTAAKDPTRGGLAANIVEMAEKSKVKIILDETKIPFRKEIFGLTNLLGIDPFVLPSEGRFIGGLKRGGAFRAISILQKFNKQARIIGEVSKGRGVFLKTKIGSFKPIGLPEGKLIPRIC